MNRAQRLRAGLASVRLALREPDQFAVDFKDGRQVYPWYVWIALVLAAITGTLTYGMTMGLAGGADLMLLRGLTCTLAAGLAWSIPLPALYIFNSLSGSRLSASTTLLAALVTTSWGGLAMIASIPINWFFSVAIPHAGFLLLLNLVVFAGVGVSMVDVFARTIARLEPQRGRTPATWLLLVGAIGLELFYFFDLFQFGVH